MEINFKKNEKMKRKKWRDHDSWTMKLFSAISIELVPMPKRNTHNIHQSFIIIWDPQSPLIIIQHINLYEILVYFICS